jgi:hypothetical protein
MPENVRNNRMRNRDTSLYASCRRGIHINTARPPADPEMCSPAVRGIFSVRH